VRAARCLCLLSAVLFAVGCADSPVEPGNPVISADELEGGAGKVSVVTRNLYVGTDVDAVIGALRTTDPADDLPALMQAIETLGRTNFPARASAIADEIARARPHAVGLQEVSKIDLVLPPLGVDLHQDFLPTLLAELRKRGLQQYEVAAQVKNIEATPFPGVSLVDFDVLLVDTRQVKVRATTAQNFTANLGEVATGVVLKRGWVAAAVTIRGSELTLASTHLESGNVPGFDQLRAGQMQELVASLDPSTPAVLLGDLNDSPGSLMYQVLTGAGFVDVWTALRPGVSGNTCCHLTDLSNSLPNLTQRIDYLLARGPEHASTGLSGEVQLLGAVAEDRLSALGIWPSDHAGIAAQLRLFTLHPDS
jgi:endonuclease/exonuclease/phosphatase family metal-dependent hydrolase